jgi:hypothetical protein
LVGSVHKTIGAELQMQFMLRAMAAAEKATKDRWEKVFAPLDQLTQKLDVMEEVQQQLKGRTNLVAEVASKTAVERLLFASKTGQAVAKLRLENMTKDGDSDDARMTDPPLVQVSHETSAGRSKGSERTTGNGGRVLDGRDQVHPYLPKLSFPKFQGSEPRIWMHKCTDFSSSTRFLKLCFNVNLLDSFGELLS